MLIDQIHNILLLKKNSYHPFFFIFSTDSVISGSQKIKSNCWPFGPYIKQAQPHCGILMKNIFAEGHKYTLQ